MVRKVGRSLDCAVCLVVNEGIVVVLEVEGMPQYCRVQSEVATVAVVVHCRGSFPIDAMHLSWRLLMVDVEVVLGLQHVVELGFLILV